MTHPTELLNGKHFASAIKEDVKSEVDWLQTEHQVIPKLVVVRVGADAASEVYVNSKVKTAQELGILSEHLHFESDMTEAELLSVVEELNDDESVDGILVQLPLPKGINEADVLESIDPQKDVDGFHPFNAGKLSQGDAVLAPCTPAGVIDMLKRANIPIEGADAVVVGKSNIVGKPMAQLLLNEKATVTVCHSKSKDVAAKCATADILVAAVGVPGLIGEEHIKEGAVVVDVGINSFDDIDRIDEFFPEGMAAKRKRVIEKRGSTLVGDIKPKAAIGRAAYFTPVPGGVGLLTVAMLMKNTVAAAKQRRSLME